MKPVITIDLWKTLIFSHPDFKRNRAARLFSIRDYAASTDEINNLMSDFSRLERQFDQYQIDWHGWQPEASSIEDQVLNLLHQYNINITYRKFLALQFDALTAYTPTYHPHLPGWIRQLSADYDLVLISNTMFIPGLHLYLTLKPLLGHFKLLRFSDEVGYGKPGIQIAKDITGIKFHIGDMIETDGKFAANIGAEFLHVTPENTVIRVIDSFLNNK